jgi:hypothetical protein
MRQQSRLRVIGWCAGALLLASFAHAQTESEPERFTDFIRQAIEKITKERAKKGYDINKAFTQNLQYGKDCCVKSSAPPLTMCVAAVSEVIIEALNIYLAQNPNETAPFKALPMKSWTGGTRNDIRAHIFMFDNMGSKGTASAFRRFSIGEELPFEKLKPYDFVNFDRPNSGHAAVFLGFIDKRGEDLPEHSSEVAGFKYFSAQGKGKPDAGFWYRWAYFGDAGCPAPNPDKPRDCEIIRSSVVPGSMWHPKAWRTGQSRTNLMRDFVIAERSAQRKPMPTERALNREIVNRSAELKKELAKRQKEQPSKNFSGETTD